MITTKLLRKIQEKHPEYSIEQIKSIINKHWTVFNLKLSKAQVVDLTINKVGTIHTNRNIIHIARENTFQYFYRRSKIKTRYSDKNLLF